MSERQNFPWSLIPQVFNRGYFDGTLQPPPPRDFMTHSAFGLLTLFQVDGVSLIDLMRQGRHVVAETIVVPRYHISPRIRGKFAHYAEVVTTMFAGGYPEHDAYLGGAWIGLNDQRKIVDYSVMVLYNEAPHGAVVAHSRILQQQPPQDKVHHIQARLQYDATNAILHENDPSNPLGSRATRRCKLPISVGHYMKEMEYAYRYEVPYWEQNP